MPRTVRTGACVATVALSLVATALPGLARADEPTATPSSIASPTPADPTPTDSAPSIEATATPTPTPTLSSTPTTVTSGPARAVAPAPGGLSLRVASVGSPVAGRFYEDLGRFAVSGAASSATAGQRVQLYLDTTGKGRWTASVAATTAADGNYAMSLPVGALGSISFQTRLLRSSGTTVTSSPAVKITVADSTISLQRPATSIDALRNPTLVGQVSPARAGVRVALDVKRGTRWSTSRSAVTSADGRFSVVFAYGQARLGRYTVRASYRAANRPRTEASTAYSITRSKVLNAVVRATTAADVAKTYRSGCPVGPSKLRTITMNFYGFDRLMHRGVMIIRKDLTDDVIRGFNAALKANYPLARMNNPNVYGGNDPRQMAANNTSGFNCRKVVGNPLRQSPHSYGIAIDVNTVQNPYRDVNGKWWPKNGKKYIDRKPTKRGMLTKKSALTKRLKKDKFFWGGLWNPGRDYQHFQRK